MDLADFDVLAAVEKGHTYTVLTPYGEDKGKPTDIQIDVAGIGSKLYDTAMGRIRAYQEKQQSRGKPVDQEYMDSLYMRLVVDCTRGWTGLKENKKDVPFSKDKATEMYEKYPWLRSQVLDAMADIDTMLEKK